jgi:hypothetical protein
VTLALEKDTNQLTAYISAAFKNWLHEFKKFYTREISELKHQWVLEKIVTTFPNKTAFSKNSYYISKCNSF